MKILFYRISACRAKPGYLTLCRRVTRIHINNMKKWCRELDKTETFWTYVSRDLWSHLVCTLSMYRLKAVTGFESNGSSLLFSSSLDWTLQNDIKGITFWTSINRILDGLVKLEWSRTKNLDYVPPTAVLYAITGGIATVISLQSNTSFYLVLVRFTTDDTFPPVVVHPWTRMDLGDLVALVISCKD